MTGYRNPTTHISRIASDFTIQMVNPYDLKEAMDLSTDHPDGTPHDPRFVTLLQRKYGNCTDWFLDNLESEGIKEPLVMIIRNDGLWQFDDGHHRLAWALLNNVEVPVVFAEMLPGMDIEDEHTGYYVSRHDVNERHDTTAEAAEELINEAEDYLHKVAEPTNEFIVPTPRLKPQRHRTGGRHRA